MSHLEFEPTCLIVKPTCFIIQIGIKPTWIFVVSLVEIASTCFIIISTVPNWNQTNMDICGVLSWNRVNMIPNHFDCSKLESNQHGNLWCPKLKSSQHASCTVISIVPTWNRISMLHSIFECSILKYERVGRCGFWYIVGRDKPNIDLKSHCLFWTYLVIITHELSNQCFGTRDRLQNYSTKYF
mgnify:CR=1 FL=1